MTKLEGSDWKGSRSLSRSLFAFLRLKHANRRISPRAAAPTPTDATATPTICGFVNLVAEEVADAVADVTGSGRDAVGNRVADPAAVVITLDEDAALLVLSELLELFNVLVG